MDPLRLESIWQEQLRANGWSDRAALQTTLYLAQSTWALYNRQINKLRRFCVENNVLFPPTSDTVLVEFLCDTADNSLRPCSVLKSTSAAIGCYYEAFNKPNPCLNGHMQRLIHGLVKSGTWRPMYRSKIMPVTAFTQLFEAWPANEDLTIRNLRLKAITLMALAFMARPSDFAPKGVVMNSNLEPEKMTFSVDQLHFEECALTVNFFGIKNDSSRSGFEVKIPGSTNAQLDPVSCMRVYIQRTTLQRFPPERPVFLTLRRPFRGLSGAGIASVLNETIRLAGLDPKVFSAKSFRPTGATWAVQSGVKPETAMQIGRWKTQETFLGHYVYPQAPDNYSTKLFQS